MADKDTLYSIPLRAEDIDLITYALRKLARETGFGTLKVESVELINYVSQEKEARMAERKNEQKTNH